MRRVLDEFGDRVLIGEIYLPTERLVTYYGKDLSGAHLPFNFALLSAPWHARDDRADHRRLRGGIAAGCVAELGARQSRPAAGRQPRRS